VGGLQTGGATHVAPLGGWGGGGGRPPPTAQDSARSCRKRAAAAAAAVALLLLREHMCDLAGSRGGSGGRPPTAQDSARSCRFTASVVGTPLPLAFSCARSSFLRVARSLLRSHGGTHNPNTTTARQTMKTRVPHFILLSRLLLLVLSLFDLRERVRGELAGGTGELFRTEIGRTSRPR
jgi:hypothetical protein